MLPFVSKRIIARGTLLQSLPIQRNFSQSKRFHELTTPVSESSPWYGTAKKGLLLVISFMVADKFISHLNDNERLVFNRSLFGSNDDKDVRSNSGEVIFRYPAELIDKSTLRGKISSPQTAGDMQGKVMATYDYVILGGGASSQSCLMTIDSICDNKDRKVLLIDRLDKARGNSKVASINCDVATGFYCRHIDFKNKLVVLNDGSIINFNKLYVGTDDRDGDFNLIDNEAKSVGLNGKDVAIVGGNLIHIQLALNALSTGKAKSVHQIYAEPNVLNSVLPDYIKRKIMQKLKTLSDAYVQHNFTLLTDVSESLKDGSKKLVLQCDSWDNYYLEVDSILNKDTLEQKIDTDRYINVLEASGAQIANLPGSSQEKVVVNQQLECNRDVYVGSTNCLFYNKYVNESIGYNQKVLDHELHSGHVAALNMCGYFEDYDYLVTETIDFKDLDVKLEFIGMASSDLETIGFWESTSSKRQNKDDIRGVLCYLNKQGYLVGCLLYNMHNLSNEALESIKTLIKDQIEYKNLPKKEIISQLQLGISPVIGSLQQPLMIKTTISKNKRESIHGSTTPSSSSSGDKPKNKYLFKRSESSNIGKHPNDTITRSPSNWAYWRSS